MRTEDMREENVNMYVANDKKYIFEYRDFTQAAIAFERLRAFFKHGTVVPLDEVRHISTMQELVNAQVAQWRRERAANIENGIAITPTLGEYCPWDVTLIYGTCTGNTRYTLYQGGNMIVLEIPTARGEISFRTWEKIQILSGGMAEEINRIAPPKESAWTAMMALPIEWHATMAILPEIPIWPGKGNAALIDDDDDYQSPGIFKWSIPKSMDPSVYSIYDVIYIPGGFLYPPNDYWWRFIKD